MKKKLFFNLVGSINVTIIFLLGFVLFLSCLFVNLYYNHIENVVGLSILISLLTPPIVIVLRVACWRFCIFENDKISVGGFLRKKKTIRFVDVVKIDTAQICVFHTTIHTIEKVYCLKCDALNVYVPINSYTDAVIERIRQTMTSNEKNLSK